MINEKYYILKLFDYNISYEDIKNKNNFIIINNDIKSFCIVNYLDNILKDTIFYLYNKNKENNNYIETNKNIYEISDADIFQILILNSHFDNYDNLLNDIKQLKNINNFAIINSVDYNLKLFYKKKNVSRFFVESKNISIIENNNWFNELLFKIINYNNTDLIDTIISKFEGAKNPEKEDKSGQIEFESSFIKIICLCKRDENVVKQIYKIFKKNNFNLYKINKTYRNDLPLILMEFMYLFEEKEKIIIYKSLFQYYEEMYYYFYFLEKDNFEYALNNLNNGISEDILNFYFENFEEINKKETRIVEDVIIDYFYKYIKILYEKNKNVNLSFQDYLYDLSINKKFEIGERKFKNLWGCYCQYFTDNSESINKDKLFEYCNNKYLYFNKCYENHQLKDLKKALFLE